MDFTICNQKEILENPSLTSFILDTTADNLSYIYGEEMRSEESRQTWIKYNLMQTDKTWRTVIGFRDGNPLGFITYKINNGDLYICDIEIIKTARRNPVLLGGMLKEMIISEKFTCISGYINRDNTVSQKNFLKYATEINESAKGYSFKINEEAVQKIKEKFLRH